jgi:hypothetical protein
MVRTSLAGGSIPVGQLWSSSRGSCHGSSENSVGHAASLPGQKVSVQRNPASNEGVEIKKPSVSYK